MKKVLYFILGIIFSVVIIISLALCQKIRNYFFPSICPSAWLEFSGSFIIGFITIILSIFTVRWQIDASKENDLHNEIFLEEYKNINNVVRLVDNILIDVNKFNLKLRGCYIIIRVIPNIIQEYREHKTTKVNVQNSIKILKASYLSGINGDNDGHVNKGIHYHIISKIDYLRQVSKVSLSTLNTLSINNYKIHIENNFKAILYLCDKISILDNNIFESNLKGDLYNYQNVKCISNQMRRIITKFKKVRKILKKIPDKLNNLEKIYK